MDVGGLWQHSIAQPHKKTRMEILALSLCDIDGKYMVNLGSNQMYIFSNNSLLGH